MIISNFHGFEVPAFDLRGCRIMKTGRQETVAGGLGRLMGKMKVTSELRKMRAYADGSSTDTRQTANSFEAVSHVKPEIDTDGGIGRFSVEGRCQQRRNACLCLGAIRRSFGGYRTTPSSCCTLLASDEDWSLEGLLNSHLQPRSFQQICEKPPLSSLWGHEGSAIKMDYK